MISPMYNKNETRQRIVISADHLFYIHGFEHTSLADIAKALNISKGNFYHHFKSKDDILEAVIRHRLGQTQHMLEDWSNDADHPKARLERFIHLLAKNEMKILAYGCPVGTLCSELNKLDHIKRQHATQLFQIFRIWLKRQFELLNLHDQADQLALHLLVWSQGVAVLASSLNGQTFIQQEIQLINVWLSHYIPND